LRNNERQRKADPQDPAAQSAYSANEIADILQISRSRVAAHIMDFMRKGMIKGKGYILTEQEYCVVVGAINMDIRGIADIHYPQAASNREHSVLGRRRGAEHCA
jgi:biotin operon repressor